MARVSLLLLLISIHLGLCAVWYQQPTTSTTDAPQSPRIVATNNGNYSVSFVPLITLLAGILPRIINRMRSPTATTDARDLSGAPTPVPGIPQDFKGANPCLDSILVRRPYPGNACFFYQCELYELASPICRLQVLQDPDSPRDVDYRTVERKSSLLRISDCLAIRLYRCSVGHIYDKIEKKCTRKPDTPFGDERCLLKRTL